MSCASAPSSDFDPIVQGADYAYDLEVSEIPDGETVAVPVDLTDAVFRAQLRRTPAASTVLAEFVPSVTDAENGKVSFGLSHSVTASIPATPCESGWAHDVFVDLADGRTLCLVPLTYLAVSPAVSRD